MNWEMFFSGLALFVIAFFWRRLSVWVYGEDGKEKYWWYSYKKIADWAFIVMLILAGLVVILVSFAPKNN